MEDDGGDLRVSPVGSDQRNALKKAVKYLGEVTGQPPKKLEIPNWKYGLKVWRHLLTEEPEKIELELTNRKVCNCHLSGSLL
jgi:hypothetical protein